MCGRYTLHSSLQQIADHFQLAGPETLSLKASYNITPSQDVSAIRLNDHGERQLVKLRWGLIPAWSKEPKTPYSTINARAETVASKPLYRNAYRHRRCLIVVDGFYEWQKLSSGKQPWYIRVKDQDVFAFAGLWEHWEGTDEQVIDSCSIVTTEANELMRPIHNRMPVLLDAKDYNQWLNPESFTTGQLDELLRPCPSERMEAYKVSTYVNSPSHNDETCIAPLT